MQSQKTSLVETTIWFKLKPSLILKKKTFKKYIVKKNLLNSLKISLVFLFLFLVFFLLFTKLVFYD